MDLQKSPKHLMGIVVLLALAACSTFANSPPTHHPEATTPTISSTKILPVEEVVELRFVCPQWYMPEIEALAETFHVMHPHIRINLIAIENLFGPDGMDGNRVELWQRIVSSADVGLWDMLPLASRLGLIKDLTPFIQSDTGFDRDDFYPFMLKHYQWDDGQWGLPAWVIPTVIVYNKDAFDEAGLPYPRPGWNQDEFLHLTQQLMVRNGEEVIQYGSMCPDLAFLPMMKGLVGGGPFDYPELATSQVAEELRWYTDLMRMQGTMAAPETLVEQGRVAMWEDYLINLDYLRQYNTNIGIAPYPLGKQDANIFTSRDTYFMSNATIYPQESWQWLKFLTEHKWWRLMPAAMAPRRSVMERTGYWAQWTEDEASVLRFALAHPLGEPWGMVNWALREAAHAVLQGQDLDVALEAAQQQALKTYHANAQVTPVAVQAVSSFSEDPKDKLKLTFASQSFDNAFYVGLAGTFNTVQAAYYVEIVSPQEVTTADCFSGSSDIVQGQGTLRVLNLQPFIDRDPTLNLTDFAFMDAFRAQGDVYGLPTHTAAAVLYYNQDLFDAAGVAYPQPGWGLDDFLRAAQALTRGAGDAQQYGFIPLDGDAGTLPLFVALHGADLWDAAGQPRFTAPDVVAAVTWYADLALKHGVMPAASASLPDPTPADLQRRETVVKTGRAAMWSALVGLGQSATRVALPGGVIGVAPLPGAARALLLPQGLYIAADTPHPEGCWQWLTFAVTRLPPAPELGIPAYRPTLLADTFAVQVGDDVAATYRALADYASVTQPPGTGGQRRALLEALAAILEGAAPETALAEAQRQAQNR